MCITSLQFDKKFSRKLKTASSARNSLVFVSDSRNTSKLCLLAIPLVEAGCLLGSVLTVGTSSNVGVKRIPFWVGVVR